MANVSCQVKIYAPKLRALTGAQAQALAMTAEALHTEVVQAQVMPRDSGTLQNTSTFVDTSRTGNNRVYIISQTPYARRLYFHPEYHFSKVENPNARGEWYDDWVRGSKKDFCKRAFARFYKQLTGV